MPGPPGQPPGCAGTTGRSSGRPESAYSPGRGVGKVGLVDHLHRPVNDRFLDGLQPRLAAHDELAEGQHEVGFQRQRVFFLRIVEVDVRGVHIVGAGRGQPDHLTAQPLHRGANTRPLGRR